MKTSEQKKSTPKKANWRKGGLRTMPFIIANEAFEKIAGYGLLPNMILYLMKSYHFSLAGGTSVLFIWGAISNFMPILGAFLSDSYFGRFLVISVASIITLMGLIGIWLTAIISKLTPPPCKITETCIKPNPSQLAFLFMSFALMSIGAGGIRPCSIAFGADQFDNPKDPNNKRILQSFFNWYYASIGVSLMIALTVIVYIQNRFGWVIGFGIPVGLMLIAAVMFFLGSKLYVKVKPNQSLLTGLAQVLVAAWKKRNVEYPMEEEEERRYYQAKGSKIVPSLKIRCLNKACIITNPEEELKPDSSPSDSWSLCSVIQVEVLKTVIELLPIWSTGIMIGVTISQHTFPVIQASSMNRHVAGKFKIPPGSFGIFAVIALTIWITLYDQVIVPHLSKYTKNPRGIGVLTRIGLGLVVSCFATATAALVERKRRTRALHEFASRRSGWEIYPISPTLNTWKWLSDTVQMSAMWLIPQYSLTGLGEALNAIGQIELYYSKFPKSMGSIAVALFALNMAIANLVGSLIVRIIDAASKKGGRESWISNNLNKGHYDYYYWILSILSVVNVVYFTFCSRAYKCSEEEKVWDENVIEEGESLPINSKEVTMLEMPKSKESSSPIYFSA